MNYVRRCKTKDGFERYERVHAADNHNTFCGKALNEMWFVESSAGMSLKDVTCPKCRKAIERPMIAGGVEY